MEFLQAKIFSEKQPIPGNPFHGGRWARGHLGDSLRSGRCPIFPNFSSKKYENQEFVKYLEKWGGNTMLPTFCFLGRCALLSMAAARLSELYTLHLAKKTRISSARCALLSMAAARVCVLGRCALLK